MTLYLLPYSPFLNPIEDIFSAWRWKVYDRQPLEHATLLQAIDEACDDISEDQCQSWIRHDKSFPRCMNNNDINCGVDENGQMIKTGLIQIHVMCVCTTFYVFLFIYLFLFNCVHFIIERKPMLQLYLKNKKYLPK